MEIFKNELATLINKHRIDAQTNKHPGFYVGRNCR